MLVHTTLPHYVTENENGDARQLFIPNICLKDPNSAITYISIYIEWRWCKAQM